MNPGGRVVVRCELRYIYMRVVNTDILCWCCLRSFLRVRFRETRSPARDKGQGILTRTTPRSLATRRDVRLEWFFTDLRPCTVQGPPTELRDGRHLSYAACRGTQGLEEGPPVCALQARARSIGRCLYSVFC